MKNITIEDDVHKDLKVYQVTNGYPSLSAAIQALLTVREEANKILGGKS